MVHFRRRSSRDVGWRQSALFNALLVGVPILLAQIIAGAMSAASSLEEPTPAALFETRKRIDRVFSDLPPNGADRRDFWADLVERELGQRDLAAARGFLLAAPEMLGSDDVRALEAAAEESNGGDRDARLTRAALLFLPNDISARFEAAHRPVTLSVATTARAAPPPAEGDETEPSAAASGDGSVEDGGEAARGRRFMLLGDPEDLAAASRAWLLGEPSDTLVLRLDGLALVADRLEGPSAAQFAEDAPQAASLIKAARRSRRLKDTFSTRLAQRVEAALPLVKLRANLEEALETTRTSAETSEAVLDAYARSVAPDALPRLTQELRHVATLSQSTGASGAVALLEQARSPGELRRARLIAEAGGDRAVALVKQLGHDALASADAGVRWTRGLIFQVMLLAGALIGLAWSTMAGLGRAFSASSA